MRLVVWVAIAAAAVGVFSTWTNDGPVSLDGTQGPNNGWLVLIVAAFALGWTTLDGPRLVGRGDRRARLLGRHGLDGRRELGRQPRRPRLRPRATGCSWSSRRASLSAAWPWSGAWSWRAVRAERDVVTCPGLGGAERRRVAHSVREGVACRATKTTRRRKQWPTTEEGTMERFPLHPRLRHAGIARRLVIGAVAALTLAVVAAVGMAARSHLDRTAVRPTRA